MSSSLVLSPPPPIASVSESSSTTSRGHRSSRTTYPRRAREHPSISPVPTNASSTGMSTRSRRSYSRSLSHAGGSPSKQSSPEKRSMTSSSSRKNTDIKVDGEIDYDDSEAAALGLELGEDEETLEQVIFQPLRKKQEQTIVKKEQEEEGEPEIDTILDAGSQAEESVLPLEEPGTDTPVKKNVIRLVLGRKRKAEGEEEIEKAKVEEQEPEQEQTENVVAEEKEMDTERGREQEREEDRAEESIHGDERADSRDDDKHDERHDGPRRMPRKKRKWLKKGEVDPDDPVAVARQREKHRIIDEAIESLDKQEEMLLADSHPQLLWLWAELDKRRDLQLKWLEARHEAVIDDLATMRDHEKSATKSDFKVKRAQLASDIVRDNRHKMARISAERIALKRNPDCMPNLRAGRGGGGWSISDKLLLSTGAQQLTPIEVHGEIKQRPSIPRGIQSMDYSEIQSDRTRMGAVREAITRSPSPPPSKPRVPSGAPPSVWIAPQHNTKSRHTSVNQPEWTHQKPPEQQPPPARSYNGAFRPPRDLDAHQWNAPPVFRPRSPEIIHAQPKRVEQHANNHHHHHRYDPQPSHYDPRSQHDHDYDAKLRRDRLPPPPPMPTSRSDASRYGYWPPPLNGSSASDKNGRMSNSTPSYHHPYLPRPPVPPPSLGLPPRA
ncbi:hypothetical protein CI109_106183 [Kwoniella shandongensis]|uniref:Uncharacterized protein n=1 Tax=Kwoniella shandongensis TaxID=1734106 RepID=A0A5M6BY93_9TREE|nr:uncharacterized protein CI109_003788 [Kwoniella shandongensis]KAA5527817.1 hypothetical protein CI109_003788 [Kwoniella shandongensis]